MATLQEAVDDFLSQKRLAVAGVSRGGNEAANGIFRKLRDAGYEVYPTNPKAEEVEGVPCYPNLQSIPESIDGVVVATHPDMTEQVVSECVEIGVTRLWLHRSFGQGSVSDAAVELARENNITIIPGGCPMMFVEPVDIGHKCIRWFTGLMGSLPKEV
jgi:predicted CoA-binding protein